MKSMKKLIAALLCLTMIPCTYLTVFAVGDVNEVNVAGTVIASRSFDGDDVNGCEVSKGAPSISKDTGHLIPASNDWHKIEMVTDTEMNGTGTYSIQQTFRWTYPQEGNDAIYFGAYFCDYNINYNGNIQNFAANNSNAKVSDEVKNAWAVSEEKIYSEWVTATLVIAENKPVKFIVKVGDKECEVDYAAGKVADVTKYNKSGTEQTGTSEYAVYTGGNTQAVEIYNFRVLAQDNSIISSYAFDGDNINGCKVSAGAPSISKDTGHLIPASGAWHKIEMVTDTEMNGTGTYSIQQTFRWTYPQEGNDSIYFGAYFCDYNINYNGNIQNFAANNSNAKVSDEVKNAWAVSEEKIYSEWVTATLVIAENKPVKFIVKVGDKECEVDYAAGKVADVTKYNKSGTEQTGTSEYAVYTGGNTQAAEIYDFRVYEGDISGNANISSYRTPASADVIEMYGTQEAIDKSAVRFIAELKNTDVDGVAFEVRASRTKDNVTTYGKTKIMEHITVGYTSITETIDGRPQVVRAEDGSLFVLFVIRDIDLETYDEYTFTVSCSAGGSFCKEISYTIGK